MKRLVIIAILAGFAAVGCETADRYVEAIDKGAETTEEVITETPAGAWIPTEYRTAILGITTILGAGAAAYEKWRRKDEQKTLGTVARVLNDQEKQKAAEALDQHGRRDKGLKQIEKAKQQ